MIALTMNDRRAVLQDVLQETVAARAAQDQERLELVALRAELLTQIEAKDAEIIKYDAEIEVLKSIIARMDGESYSSALPIVQSQTPQEPPPQERTNGDWVSMPRTDAIERMMAEIGRPISPTQLSGALQRVGRAGDTPDVVGSAFSYLKRKNRIRRVGRGRWVLNNSREEEVSDSQEGNGAVSAFTGDDRQP